MVDQEKGAPQRRGPKKTNPKKAAQQSVQAPRAVAADPQAFVPAGDLFARVVERAGRASLGVIDGAPAALGLAHDDAIAKALRELDASRRAISRAAVLLRERGLPSERDVLVALSDARTEVEFVIELAGQEGAV